MSLNTCIEPPGQIENGIVSTMIAAERDDADDLGVDLRDGLAGRHPAHGHRGEAGDRGQLGQVEHLRARESDPAGGRTAAR